MSRMTTESGQDARSDLIAMFQKAQQAVLTERKRNRGFVMAITRVVETSTVRERGDDVEVQMPRESWQALQDSVTDQP